MASVQRAACRTSSTKGIIHQVCLQKLIMSLSMKNLWSPAFSILFLLLPVITCAFSHCLDFSHCGFEWGVQIGLGCVLLLHRNFWRRFKESPRLLEDTGRFITTTCTRGVWLSLVKYVLVWNTSCEWLKLSHCLNLNTCFKYRFFPELDPWKALTGTDCNRFVAPSLWSYLWEQESSLSSSGYWWFIWAFMLTRCLCLLGIIITMNPVSFHDLKKGNLILALDFKGGVVMSVLNWIWKTRKTVRISVGIWKNAFFLF